MAAAASSSVPSCLAFFNQPLKRRPHQALQVRAHSSRDEAGRSNDIVDASMRVLRERIEEVKIKERLERCCKCEYGWNYAPPGYNYKLKKEVEFSQLFDLVGLVFGTIGFTCVSGTILLCLVSLFFHLYQ